MKRFLIVLLVIGTILAGFSSSILSNLPKPNKAEAYAWSTNNLASDGGFINIDGLGVNGVQSILNSTGGFLASYSEGGRSAAQIIVDASHGYDDASGSINGITINTSTGTINPIAIVATLQKEQSLIYMKDRNDGALNAAMGYGCPDGGGCNEKYRGFTNQVEWGAWQLRYNYERASGHGFSDYQVGQTQNIDDVNVTFDNRCTASLYRYTPHLGTNFSKYFEQWGGNGNYFSARVTSQTSAVSALPGTTVPMSVSFVNGSAYTWTSNTNLATDREQNEVFMNSFKDATWLGNYRIASLSQELVAPGETGTYNFNITIPNVAPGQYRLFVRMVEEGIGWFGPEANGGAWWYVNVQSATPRTGVPQARSIGQSGPVSGVSGAVVPMSVTFRNDSSYSWGTSVNLATDHEQNESFMTAFNDGTWPNRNRIAGMSDNSVAPGGSTTYTFNIKIPDISPGQYRFFARLVDDGYSWFGPNVNGGAWWYINVQSASPQARVVGQSGPITGVPGTIVPMSVTFNNTSNYTWDSYVNLATDRWQNEVFLTTFNSDWTSKYRIASPVSNSVSPGSNSTYTFNVKIPNLAPGQYRFYVRLVHDGRAWFEPDANGGAWWYVNVQ